MNIRWTMCALLIGLLGTAGPGCDILKEATQQGEEGNDEAEKAEREEQEGEEEDGEEKEDEDKDKPEETADADDEKDAGSEDGSETEVAVVEKEDYVQASVELACVDMKLGENDKIDLGGVEKEILGTYGFDDKSFSAAGDKFDGEDEVDTTIEEKLEDCTEEQAKRYAGIIEGESERSEQEEKPEPEPTPKSVGNFRAQISNSAGFDNATLQIAVKENFNVRGTFRGSREGKGFRIPFSGRASKSNEVNANGSDSGNRVSVTGDVGPSGVSAELSGTIWDKDFRTTMEAK